LRLIEIDDFNETILSFVGVVVSVNVVFVVVVAADGFPDCYVVMLAVAE
jgi:hypothetical protein